MDWRKDQPVLVAGAGISGTNALGLILGQGYTPILYDSNPNVNLNKVYDKLGRKAQPCAHNIQ